MSQILPNGGSGGGGHGGGGGGGQTGTGTGSTSVPSGLPANENGGLFAPTYYLMIPMQNSATGTCSLYTYDPTSFDDTTDGGYYKYRVEDVSLLRVPTVRRVGIIYRDLGLAKFTVTLTGTNDQRQVVSNSVVVQIGNSIATNALLTILVDITLTAFRPQLSFSRNAGDGPLSIVSATLIGEVEEVSL